MKLQLVLVLAIAAFAFAEGHEKFEDLDLSIDKLAEHAIFPTPKEPVEWRAQYGAYPLRTIVPVSYEHMAPYWYDHLKTIPDYDHLKTIHDYDHLKTIQEYKVPVTSKLSFDPDYFASRYGFYPDH